MKKKEICVQCKETDEENCSNCNGVGYVEFTAIPVDKLHELKTPEDDEYHYFI